MNWILAEDLAKAHHDALLRVAAGERLARSARAPRAHNIRKALGTPLVRAGLALAAGLAAARSASDVVRAARCDEAPATPR